MSRIGWAPALLALQVAVTPAAARPVRSCNKVLAPRQPRTAVNFSPPAYRAEDDWLPSRPPSSGMVAFPCPLQSGQNRS